MKRYASNAEEGDLPRLADGRLPRLVVYDLDHTLIDGDSTRMWTEQCYREGVITDPKWREIDERMKIDYARGRLDLQDFISKRMSEYSKLPTGTVHEICARLAEELAVPLVFTEAAALVGRVHAAGILQVILSASDNSIVRAIAKRCFPVDDTLAIDLIEKDGHFTDRIHGGVPSFQDLLSPRGIGMKEVVFFTDSRNDLPLAREVGRTYCVNPDPVLRDEAVRRGWPVLRWHAAGTQPPM